MNKTIRNGISGLVALGVASLAPMKSAASSWNWSTPVTNPEGTQAVLSLGVGNNDAGTSYDSVQANLNQLMLIYGLSESNITLGISSGSGYVNTGWNIGFTGEGNGTFAMTKQPGNPFADNFTEGAETLITAVIDLTAIDPELYNSIGPIRLGENTQGTTYRAMSGTTQFTTQASYIPIPEPTAMALLALGLAGLGLKRPKYINKEDITIGPSLSNR